MTGKEDIYYVRMIKAGDQQAFTPLVRRYQGMIFSLIRRIVENAEDAEDITQEVFVKIFQSIHRFREESDFSTWIYRIAYNTAISELRKRRHDCLSLDEHVTGAEEEELAVAEESATKEEQLRLLEDLLTRLPAADALLITMYYLDEKSIREISRITGLSESNIKVKLHRIRKFLNFELNKLLQA